MTQVNFLVGLPQLVNQSGQFGRPLLGQTTPANFFASASVFGVTTFVLQYQ